MATATEEKKATPKAGVPKKKALTQQERRMAAAVTARKAAEQKLSQCSRRLETLEQSAKLGVATAQAETQAAMRAAAAQVKTALENVQRARRDLDAAATHQTRLEEAVADAEKRVTQIAAEIGFVKQAAQKDIAEARSAAEQVSEREQIKQRELDSKIESLQQQLERKGTPPEQIRELQSSLDECQKQSLSYGQALVVSGFRPSEWQREATSLYIRLRRLQVALQQKQEWMDPGDYSSPDRVVAVFGHSTSGKSTLIRRYVLKYPLVREMGLDLELHKAVLDCIKMQGKGLIFRILDEALVPRPYGLHIINAVLHKTFKFKHDNVASVEQQKAAQRFASIAHTETLECAHAMRPGLSRKLLDKVMGFYQRGQLCIFDMMNMDAFESHPISTLPVTKVLIFTLFNQIAIRMRDRDVAAKKEGLSNELRSGTLPLFQYAKLFEPRSEDDDHETTDVVTRLEVEDQFNYLFDEWYRNLAEEDIHGFEDEQEQMRIADLARLYKELGFVDKSVQQVELVPRYKQYDYIFNSAVMTADEMLSQLVTGETKRRHEYR